MMTPMQSVSRILRAFAAALVVAAAVAGTAYGVTRSARQATHATVVPAPSITEVADEVAALGSEPADLPALDDYKPPTLKVFVAPKPRIVVRETRHVVERRKAKTTDDQTGPSSDQSGGAQDAQPPVTTDEGDDG